MATLLSAVSSDGAGTALDYDQPRLLNIRGTFDDCIVYIEFSDDGGTTYTPTDKRFTSPDHGILDLGAGTFKVRAVVDDAGGSTSITATLGGSATW